MEKENKVKMIVESGAFDRHADKTRISVEAKNYSGEIKAMNGYVDELDRFDDFDSLHIPTEQFEKTDGEYGIARMPEHLGKSVLFDHQIEAAKRFLRDKRGFGLLADVVGSGKTYEAGLVLSELAARNKVRSVLFIVPSQAISDWIRVMEMQFGLGRGALYRVEDEKYPDGTIARVGKPDRDALAIEQLEGYSVPRRPVIVTFEQFVKWGNDCTDLLFDVIIVDEAHHLCAEEGQYSRAMKLLSRLVALKKAAKRTFCLLLTATPHSGNLKKMFRLWYFVKCTGGDPNDFDEKDDRDRTATYRNMKKNYEEVICKGASTVMEFVMAAKEEEIQNALHKEQFDAYLVSQGLSLAKYYDGTPAERNEWIDKYCATEQGEKIKEEIIANVAKAYHRSVLGSIMIRQSAKNRMHKEKRAINFLFYRTKKTYERQMIYRDGVRELRLDLDHINDDRAIFYDDTYFSIDSYLDEFAGTRNKQAAAAEMIRQALVSVDNVDDFTESNNPYFIKKHSLRYYTLLMREMPTEVENRLYIVGEENDPLEHKYAALTDILRRHASERVIVFFDYDLKRKERVVEEVCHRLKKSEFASRFLNGRINGKAKTERIFNEKEDALLVVTEPAFTESVNLQAASIVVNFQVVADPVAMDQRIGRVFRLGQKNDVIIYSLADMDRLEGYVLTYLSRIGVLTSNSGDATILAGSNSEMMIAVRCDLCGKVKLIPESEYEKKKDTDEMICDTPDCRRRGRRFGKIVVTDFKCDKCGATLTRSEEAEGYECIAVPGLGNTPGILENSGEENDRTYHCRKPCAMLCCSRLREMNCPVVAALKEDPKVTSGRMIMLCAKCPNKADCKQECWPSAGIEECMKCGYATCIPKPHKLVFDKEKWEAECPCCGRIDHGKLQPVIASSFASYVKCSWDFKQDKGESFCGILRAEADKVAQIKEILDKDVDNDKESAEGN